MKKMKKVFAVILSLAMVLGMSMTAFAAKEKATITVNGGDPGVWYSYVQVIKPGPGTSTGWEFVNDAAGKAYAEAFGLLNEGEEYSAEIGQSAIQRLINTMENKEPKVSSEQISTALEKVVYLGNFTSLDVEQNQWEVTQAGVYVIKGVDTSEGEKVVYNNMAAYVGFKPIEGTTGNYELDDAVLSAKKKKPTVSKDHDNEDGVAAIGDEVTYTVKAIVPYINGDTDRTYRIIDKIKGADYVLKEGTTDIVDGTVTVAGATYPVEIKINKAKLTEAEINDGYANAFEINLDELVENPTNPNAGQEIVITYKAKLTALTADNKAMGGNKTEEDSYGDDTKDVMSGKITFIKKGEEDKVLEGAGFEVIKAKDKDGNSVNPEEPQYFIKEAEGVYKHVRVEDLPDGVKGILDNTENPTLEHPVGDTIYVKQVFTKADGTVIVNGLDVGEYRFEEKTAPEGYSINAEGVSVTLQKSDEDGKVIEATGEMTDTKLSELPSTGGIGTTIFTIGGCLIMIIAAALFFASRRKSEK